MMKRFYTAVLIVLITGTAAFAQVPPRDSDTLWVDSIATHSGQKAVVGVHFANSDSLRGIQCPLKFFYPELIIDSISFAGSRVEDIMATYATIRQDSADISLGAAVFGSPDHEPVPPGRGLFASIYVSIPDDFETLLVPFDTVTLRFSDINDQSIRPMFRMGYIDNTFAPNLGDSVWIDDAAVDAGQPFTVTVKAYNERSVSRLLIPLSFASDNISFDSLSVAGTRSASAILIDVPSDNIDKTALLSVTFANGDLLAPGSGPVGIMHFTCASIGTTPQVIVDTSAAYDTELQFILGPIDNYLPTSPDFSPGMITVNLVTDADDDDFGTPLPTEYGLMQNQPNPFNPATTITFALPKQSRVSIEVFNILGEKIRTLVDGALPAGTHSIVFDGCDSYGRELATGVYLYRMKTGQDEYSRKMILLK